MVVNAKPDEFATEWAYHPHVTEGGVMAESFKIITRPVG